MCPSPALETMAAGSAPATAPTTTSVAASARVSSMCGAEKKFFTMVVAVSLDFVDK